MTISWPWHSHVKQLHSVLYIIIRKPSKSFTNLLTDSRVSIQMTSVTSSLYCISTRTRLLPEKVPGCGDSALKTEDISIILGVEI